MPKQVSLQNNFTGGLKTEFTGLNFPENAATQTSNCVYSIIGDVLRREGIDFEANAIQQPISTASKAISYYRWKNAGGDGETEILVVQIGSNLYFFETSAATLTSPVSAQLLELDNSPQLVGLSAYLASGSTADPSQVECQFADGNGYLFVFHPNCDPFFVTLSSGIIGGTLINIQIRDFNGLRDNLSVQTRPGVNSTEHNYNLQNQGWGPGTAFWTLTGSNGTTGQLPLVDLGFYANLFGGDQTFIWALGTGSVQVTGTVAGSANIVVGQAITISWSGNNNNQIGSINPAYSTNWNGNAYGIVTGYPGSGNTMTIDITSTAISYSNSWIIPLGSSNPAQQGFPWIAPAAPAPQFNVTIYPSNIASGSQIGTWVSAFNDYPSNADIWWLYKDSSGVYDPVSTVANVTFPTTPAPKGHFILNAFNQQFSQISGIAGITPIITTQRPQTGVWYSGRVWYAGANATQFPTGDQQFYTWTENIYFSQIITSQSNPEFGLCYQSNDPTDQNFFDIESSDGGVIVIPGSGNIVKLFAIQNGILVFASNGIWFITGSQGIGFSATDYTVTKISSVQSISGSSFVNLLGYPVFWNEEGIYTLQPSKSGGFEVEPITVGTILSFYANIPKASKIYAKGDYDPVNYIVNWVYRSTAESGIANRYQFDSTLNLNTFNKAFYPYAISGNDTTFVNGISYVNYPPGAVAASVQPEPTFKYLTSNGTNFTFSEENDVTFRDWSSSGSSVDFTSNFITGYSLAGKGLTKWQPTIVEMYSRGSGQYFISSIWDYANSGNTGRWSSQQMVTNPNVVVYGSGIAGPDLTDYNMYHRRHKLRGYGTAFQLNVSSVSGQPFDIMGWSVLQEINPSL